MKHVLVALIIILFNSILFGQSNTSDTGVHQHTGFFLRFLPGFSYTEWTKKSDSFDEITISGSGVSSRTQIGLALDENLILFYDSGLTIVGNVEEAIIDAGLGLNYYFMPINIYASFSVLSSASSHDVWNNESTNGLGINFIVGKEWWVSDNWGIGAAMYLHHRTNDTENSDVSSYSIGLLFSATYN